MSSQTQRPWAWRILLPRGPGACPIEVQMMAHIRRALPNPCVLMVGVRPLQGEYKTVISYDDDVFVWVYLDQGDRVLRYEAYAIDYDEGGKPSTLKFVIEEGVLDNIHEVPLLQDLVHQYWHQSPLAAAPFVHVGASTAASLFPTTPSLRLFYSFLSTDQLSQVHDYFASQEVALKREKRARWTRALRALGFEVISRLT